MALLNRINDAQSHLVLNEPVDRIPYEILIKGDKLSFKVEYENQNQQTFIINSNNFHIERILLSAGPNLSVHLKYNVNEITENLLVEPAYFAKFIDFSSPDTFPPFSLNAYEKPSKLAVFTHIYNEDFFLKIFIDYYSKLTHPENIYIIDHGSDASNISIIKSSGCQYVKIPRGPTDHTNIKRYVEYYQRFLLTQYKWVISVDCDELLIHKNGFASFNKFLESCCDECIIKPIIGADLIQHPDHENDTLDLSHIASLRKYYKYSKSYAKPALASTPVTWGLGFHYCINTEKIRVNEDFLMIHLAHISIQEKLHRNIKWNNMPQTEADATHVKQNRPNTYESICEQHREMLSADDLLYLQVYTKGQF